jgi:hypothetical protein
LAHSSGILSLPQSRAPAFAIGETIGDLQLTGQQSQGCGHSGNRRAYTDFGPNPVSAYRMQCRRHFDRTSAGDNALLRLLLDRCLI